MENFTPESVGIKLGINDTVKIYSQIDLMEDFKKAVEFRKQLQLQLPLKPPFNLGLIWQNIEAK
jgi:hypothetical protein